MNPRDAGACLELGKSCRGQGRWAEAEAALRQALELAPRDGRARFELGALYRDQGRFVEAMAELEGAIAVDPNLGWAHCELGRIYHRQGRASEAESALRQALGLDPRNVSARIELGALYEEQGKFMEAAAEFEKAIAIDPNRGGAHGELGRVYRRQGRVSEAEAALRKALEFDPQNSCARFEMGALCQDQDRCSEAAAEFERAIAIDPNHGRAHCELGRVYRRQGRVSEAEAALRKAIELTPQDGSALMDLGALYQSQERFAEAASEFGKAIAIDPNHGKAHCELGRVYRRQGRAPEAEAALRKALELDARDVWAHVELGVLYQGQDRFAEAASEFEKAAAINPDDGWVYRQLARIYRKQARTPEAESALRKALELDPKDCGARIELGALYEDQCQLPQAAAEFEKAIANDASNVSGHIGLGTIHLYRGQWAEAAAEYQKAVALDPRNDGAYVGLWAVYRGQGRSHEAAAALAKVSAVNPRSAFVRTEFLDRLERARAVGGTDMTRDQVFCLLPWAHLHILADGSFLPCCAWSGPPLGNVHFTSMSELWNSPGMKALRSDMMRGRPVAGCWRCYESERSGFLSMRTRNNDEFSRHRGRERLTALDGTLPWLPVPLLDIRFSNACNLRCRICDTSQSSAWVADARALGLAAEGEPIHKPYADWDSLWRQLQPLLEDGVEEIRFAGGEPLIMEEHYRILDFLIARGRTDVRLRYNTNFSTLRFQGRDVIDLWSRFRKVGVYASLDGSGRRGEYMRKGLIWDTVVANREEMLRRCPDVSFWIMATASIFNALHLPDFHRECVEKGYIAHNAFVINLLASPPIYRMQVLPEALKQRVLEAYRRHQESFLDPGGTAMRDFAAAAHSLQAQDYSGLLSEFVAMTRRLDALRGEDCREVFPELAGLFEAAE